MKKVRRMRGVDVVYYDEGDGPCVVLLHGYLESAAIWGPFARTLTGRFRVLRMDLPGHGESGTWGSIHRMEDLATTVRDIVEEEGLRRILLVGHSMGGYVTMAFADLYPELLAGYVLLHSTPFADSEEKKQNRDREISLIQCGKRDRLSM
ncbi:MAG: alpha/beta fold hydrolase [Bacteroidales bacterium]